MKTATKIWLVVALLLIVAGLILCAVSFGMTGFNVYGYETGTDYEKKEYTFAADTVTALCLTDSSRDVRVVPSADGDFHVTCYDGRGSIYAVAVDENGTLCVKRQTEKRPFGGWFTVSFGRESTDTVIAVPATHTVREWSFTASSSDLYLSDLTLTGDVKAHSTSGDLHLDRVTVQGALSLTTVSGEQYLDRVQCQTATLVATSGDVESNGLTCQGKLWVQTTSGDIELDRLEVGEGDLRSTSGDMELYLTSADYRVFAQSVSGDVQVSRSLNGGRLLEIEAVSGDIEVYAIP